MENTLPKIRLDVLGLWVWGWEVFSCELVLVCVAAVPQVWWNDWRIILAGFVMW